MLIHPLNGRLQMAGLAAGWIASLLALTSAILPTPLTYESHLQSESVREAYFLGRRNDEKTVTFFEKYARYLPMPETGPYISFIGLLTPYAQVVAHSQNNTVNYSAQRAEQDYESQYDTIRVTVRIEFTATYSAVKEQKSAKDSSGNEGFVFRAQDFWRDFRFALRQEKDPIKPRDIQGTPIYDDSGFRGAEIQLEYDAREIRSEDTKFEVITPDGQHVVAKFDLSELR